MPRLGFTFDSQFSMWRDSEQLAHRKNPKNRLTPSKSAKTSDKARPKESQRSLSLSSPTSFISNILNPSLKRTSTSLSASPVVAKPQSFHFLLKLPLAIRERIYGHVLGRNDALHILLKHKPARVSPTVAFRRCKCLGELEDCLVGKCREMSILDGVYVGWFDRKQLGLLLSCRQVYKEASTVLYSQNAFDFDHPKSLLVFTGKLSPHAFQSIKSITFELRSHLYIFRPSDNFKTSSPSSQDQSPSTFLPQQWPEIWDVIARMTGLEEIKVRVLSPFHGCIGWRENEVLDPLRKVKQTLKVFEIDLPWTENALETVEEDEPRFVIKRVGRNEETMSRRGSVVSSRRGSLGLVDRRRSASGSRSPDSERAVFV